MKDWNDKGCNLCRNFWMEGKRPTQICINVQRHTTLYRCLECKTYWEEHERFSEVIFQEEVKKYYPEVLDE